MSRLKECTIVIFFAFVLFLTGCAKSQIIGMVADQDGYPVEGVEVSIKNMAFKAQTDSRGEYLLEYSPGEFEVFYKKNGYTWYSNVLNLSTIQEVLSDTVMLWKLPPSEGGFFYENEKFRALVENYAHTQRRSERNYSDLERLSDNIINMNPILVFYGDEHARYAPYASKIVSTEYKMHNSRRSPKNFSVYKWKLQRNIEVNVTLLNSNKIYLVVRFNKSPSKGSYSVHWGGKKMEFPPHKTWYGKKSIIYDFTIVPEDKKEESLGSVK